MEEDEKGGGEEGEGGAGRSRKGEIKFLNDFRDPLNVVLWYMMLQKKNMLLTLFRQDRGQKKMADFFGNNFTEPRWKSAASKNAYALLSKKMFEQSAGFFLLGGFLNVMGKGG